MTGDNQSGETFLPTGGRVFGVAAALIGVGFVVLGFVAADGVLGWLVALGVLLAGLAWAAMLRPRVSVRGDELVLRNMIDTVHVPLAAVEEVAVRQVLAVRAGEKRYTSPAVGRGRRQIRRDDRSPRGDGDGVDMVRLAEDSYGLFVEERVRALAKDAREQRGIRLYSDEQAALAADVRRDWAVPEIAVLALSALAVVLAVL